MNKPTDLNTFRRKKESVISRNKEVTSESGINNEIVKSIMEKLGKNNPFQILNVNPDRRELIVEIMQKHAGSEGPETAATAQKTIRNMTKEDIVRLLNETDEKILRSKPSLVIASYMKILSFMNELF